MPYTQKKSAIFLMKNKKPGCVHDVDGWNKTDHEITCQDMDENDHTLDSAVETSSQEKRNLDAARMVIHCEKGGGHIIKSCPFHTNTFLTSTPLFFQM